MQREFGPGGHLQALSLPFAQAMICRTAQNAVCNQHNELTQQMCRWLLMSIDRLDGCKLAVTRERVAKLLDVRRESVMQTLGLLEKEGLISRARGGITLVKRLNMEKLVCECCGVVEEE